MNNLHGKICKPTKKLSIDSMENEIKLRRFLAKCIEKICKNFQAALILQPM